MGVIYESGSNSDPTEVKYCNFYNNTTGDYYDYDSGTWLSRLYVNNLGEVHNCISEEPQFVDSEKSRLSPGIYVALYRRWLSGLGVNGELCGGPTTH